MVLCSVSWTSANWWSPTWFGQLDVPDPGPLLPSYGCSSRYYGNIDMPTRVSLVETLPTQLRFSLPGPSPCAASSLSFAVTLLYQGDTCSG